MCKANAMNWLSEAIKGKDERKKRLASWDVLAGRLCATGRRYGDDYEKLVGRPLDFTRPTWDPGGNDSRLVWTGRLVVAAVDAVCQHCTDRRAKMAAHVVDYRERVISIQRCSTMRCDRLVEKAQYEAALQQLQVDVERYEAAMQVTLTKEEAHCAWTVAVYEAAEREETAERKRACAVLKRAQRRATKAASRQYLQEAEQQRVKLVAEVKREARDEVRVMRGLRRAERVEARRISLVNHTQSESRRRGGRRRPRVNQTRKRSDSSSTSSVLSSVCSNISFTYDLLLPAMSAMYADVVPACIFCDVVCMIRNKRRLFVEGLTTSSIASPVLLVRVLCPVHKHKLPVWRAGACLIDSMSRLVYG